jgi:hypothetical protein
MQAQNAGGHVASQGLQQATSALRLAPHIENLYKQLNLQITPDTIPAYTDAQVTGKPQKLGSGSFNTVFAVPLKKPDGSVFDGVFKPLSTTENGWTAAATGIPRDDPQIAMRNLATVSYARKLGLDVVPETTVAVLSATQGPMLGLMMEKARGKPACTMAPRFLDLPGVRAEVTKLQLLDHLTGQGDRHGANYFISIERSGRAKVTGIDNDQCFGKDLTDPNGIQQVDGDDFRWGFRGTALPPVVDTEMARKINELTPGDIREMLGNKLGEYEIEAAIARHAGVKEHVETLRAGKRIIDSRQWGHPNVQKLFNAQNSYLAREHEIAIACQQAAPKPNAGW